MGVGRVVRVPLGRGIRAAPPVTPSLRAVGRNFSADRDPPALGEDHLIDMLSF